MSTRDYSASIGQLRHLLDRGPAPISTAGLKGRIKARARSTMLRMLRPYTYYAYEVDSLILSCLSAFEQEERRNKRMDVLAEDLIATLESLRRRIAVNEQTLNAVPYIAGSPFEQFDSPVGEVTGYRSAEVAVAESPYTAFEELFRGPAERVAELQRPYLGLVAEHQPVLDVGCGRGEFLGLLTSEGIAGTGVDNDPGMVERCQALDLPATLADVNEYLDGLGDGTLGSIFSAQVIEHLPVDELRRFMSLSLRKLKPGGLFIAETVNPHSIPALKTFWVDLTHKHPIFPEVALAMCAIAGFSPAYVFAPGHDRFELAKFKSTSYAVVATAPVSTGNGHPASQ
jgi:SAM-dependent methyltransferase